MAEPQRAPASFANAPTPPDPAPAEPQKPTTAAPKPSQGVPAGRAWYVLLPLLVVAFVLAWQVGSPMLAVALLCGAVALAALGLAGHQATRRSRAARARAAARQANNPGGRPNPAGPGGWPGRSPSGPQRPNGRPPGSPNGRNPFSWGRPNGNPSNRTGTSQRPGATTDGRPQRPGPRGATDRNRTGRDPRNNVKNGPPNGAPKGGSPSGGNPASGPSGGGKWPWSGRNKQGQPGRPPAGSPNGGPRGGRPNSPGTPRTPGSKSPFGNPFRPSGGNPPGGRPTSPSGGNPNRPTRKPSAWFKPHRPSATPHRSVRKPSTWFKQPPKNVRVSPERFRQMKEERQAQRRSRDKIIGPSGHSSTSDRTGRFPRLRRRPVASSNTTPDPAATATKQPTTPKRRRTPPVAQDQALRSQPGWRPWQQPKDDAVLGAAFFGDDGLGPNPPAPQPKRAAPPAAPPPDDAPLDDNGFPLHPTGAAAHSTGGSTATPPGRDQMGVAAQYTSMVDNSTAQTRAQTLGRAADKAQRDAAARIVEAEQYDADAVRFAGMEGMEQHAINAAREAAALREDAAVRRFVASDLLNRGLEAAHQLVATE